MSTTPYVTRPDARARPGGYTRARQALHWISAALIVAMYPTGIVMARTLDDATRLNLYGVHVLIGWTIVVLSLVRVVLRYRRPVALPPGLSSGNARMYAAVHWLAMVVPLLLAASGLAAILQNDLLGALQSRVAPPAVLELETARTGHMVGVYAYLALLAVHVAGAVRYQLGRGDVLARMGLPGWLRPR